MTPIVTSASVVSTVARARRLEAGHETAILPGGGASRREPLRFRRMSRPPLASPMLLALVLVVAACAPVDPVGEPPRRVRSAASTDRCATAAGARVARRLGGRLPRRRRSSRSSSRTRSSAARRGSCSRSLDTDNVPVAGARTGRLKVGLLRPRPRTRRRRSRRPTARSSGRSRARAASTSSTSTCPRPATWGVEFTTQAPGGPRRRSACTFDVLAELDDASRSATRRPPRRPRRSPTSAATSRRSRPTRSPTRPSTRPRWPTRSPPTSRSCSCSRRRSSARAPSAARRSTSQAGRGGAPGRHVHQRRAVPARGRERPAPARPRRATATSRPRQRHERVGPAVGAVDLRGRRRRGRPRRRSS